MRYSISNKQKKQAISTTYYKHIDRGIFISIERGYRWGKVFIDLQDGEKVPSPENDEGCCISDYENYEVNDLEDESFLIVEITKCDDDSINQDALKEEIETTYEQFDDDYLDSKGWEYTMYELNFYGELEIHKA